VHFGLRPIQEFIAQKDKLLKHQLLGTVRETGRALICFCDLRLGLSYRWLNSRCIRFGHL
jgi:hypothetical protein